MQKNYFLTLILQFVIFSISNAQTTVSVSGIIKAKTSKTILPFVNVILKTVKDSVFVSGTVTNEAGSPDVRGSLLMYGFGTALVLLAVV